MDAPGAAPGPPPDALEGRNGDGCGCGGGGGGSSSSSSSACRAAAGGAEATGCFGPDGAPGGAAPGGAAPGTGPWERLFASGGLCSCLAAPEAGRCRAACRGWRALAAGAATPQELWRQEVGGPRRGLAWKQLLLGGITLRQREGTPQDAYERLCETPCTFDAVIRRDVHRTLPQEELFRERGGRGQQMLFRVLRALAIRLWDVGYCQSLNFIVATLIGVFPEDEATCFQCALALLLRHSLADLYRPKFPKLGVVVWQFDRIVEGFLPKVHAALARHGVNSEYYAIQWFLTLFASDLRQAAVRRIWDRFLVAGWRVLVQVGLALLFAVQDVLPGLDTCHALSFLRRFAHAEEREPEQLLAAAASFKVSHRMLSALEAAYGWEDDVQLLVVKDLDDGQVHWAVQAVPRRAGGPGAPEPGTGAPAAGGAEAEAAPALPRAFARGSEGAEAEAEGPQASRPQGAVLPFVLRNLDTGETSVMQAAWHEYTGEKDRQARAQAGPLSLRPPPPGEAAATAPAAAQAAQADSARPEQARGSFWMQSVQQQAARRLGQA